MHSDEGRLYSMTRVGLLNDEGRVVFNDEGMLYSMTRTGLQLMTRVVCTQ